MMEEQNDRVEEDSPEQMTARLRELFRDEAYELIAELESALLEIEKSPDQGDVINRVFRALHTIKGSGGACGLTLIAGFAHEVEALVDLVRKKKVSLGRELIDLTLAACDQLKMMFDACYHGETADESKGMEIIAAIKKRTAAAEDGAREDVQSFRAPALPEAETPEAAREEKTYRISFHPLRAADGNDADPSELLGELARLGTCAVVAQRDALSSAMGTPSWEVLLVTRWDIDAVQDVFLTAGDQWELSIEVSSERSALKDEAETAADHARTGSGEPAVQPKAAAASLPQGQNSAPGKAHSGSLASIRVTTDKLDSLVDHVGELVTIQARLNQTALTRGIPEFLAIAEELERLTSELRDEAMSIRMTPIGATFNRFKRLVRDLSRELGKEIVLVTEGAETELDKTVIERLGDPFVHLIRNSIDHGIESPSVRAAAGKPAAGTIFISAAHSGAHVLIQIRDDGAGFDLERIHAKGIERGLVREGERPSDKELLSLVFLPGFSTAAAITNISGRGVGLDVVKRSIDSLGGTILIRNNVGAGTTIELKLPLTLAIIDGFLTEVGAERYIFPLSLVEECVELVQGQTSGNDRQMIDVRGHLVPYIRLREQFSVAGAPQPIEQIVIARIDDKRVGFVVDRVIGGHQTVIKNLGMLYRDAEGLSGATILGDGTVALILDVSKLVLIAEREVMAMQSGAGLIKA